ncbi:MAG TPA: branched-chain amino acid ABC transporter permease [Mycobacteriales bacterium]|nr:branched-chain amino acid ABC transporter permease [Mycobacteriales bacterium]
MATGELLTPYDADAPGRRASLLGLATRGTAFLPVLALVLLLPRQSGDWTNDAIFAAIYAMVGLSMNVLVGYTGQISLGQQAFLGIGALTAANVVHTGTNAPDPFTFALGMVCAVAVSAGAAAVLGGIALRIRGLYLALVTLVFGAVTADAVFTIPSLNGNDAGVSAYRPTAIQTDYSYYIFAVAMVGVCLYVDVWIRRTKVGRGLIALRDNELVASSFGINVLGYKLLGFVLSGAMAGLAGGVFAFWSQEFSDKDFTATAGFNKALIFVVMVVVGGLGNRAGVVAAAAFFALLDPILSGIAHSTGWINYYTDHKAYISNIIGAVLLLQTLIFNPGGLGQVLRPFTRWFGGHPFSLHDEHGDAAAAALAGGSDVRA